MSNLLKNINKHIQEVQRISSRVLTQRDRHIGHIVIKQTNIKDKVILKSVREKQLIMYKQSLVVKLISLQNYGGQKRQGCYIQMLKEKDCQAIILYLAILFFKN